MFGFARFGMLSGSEGGGGGGWARCSIDPIKTSQAKKPKTTFKHTRVKHCMDFC